MATRLAAAVLIVSLVSLAIATIVGVNSGFDLGRNIYQDRLTSLAGSGAYDVAGELNSTRSATEALALSPETAAAIGEFGDAFDELADVTDFDATNASLELTAAYQRPYLTPARADGSTPLINEIVAADPGALYLQTRYSVETVDVETGDVVTGEPADGQIVEPRVVADPGRLADAGDGSAWTETHRRYHPAYLRIREDLGVLDLYFVEPTESRIVYSVGKGPDLGSSLVTGPFGGSVLANTVGQVINDPAAGTAVSDLSLYNGAPGAVVGVMASPVMDGPTLAGVVAVMYDGAEFTEILTAADVADDPDGTGEEVRPDVYLIGADGTLRSDPFAYLVDPTGFLDLSEETGLLSPTERAEIDANGTTVLTQPAVGATFTAAETGDDGVAERPSMTGASVYSTVGPIPFDGVDWYIASEAGLDAAETSLGAFRNILIVGASLFVIVIAFLAVAWANRLMNPVRTISERLGSTDDDHGPLMIPDQSPVEMHHLVSSFDSMVDTLDNQQVSLAVAREERLTLLRRMLPTAVAERIARGGIDSVERVPQASAVVVVVRGLGQLVRNGEAGSNRELVDRLHSELDGLADQHGLDRIKVVGDAYFAACGHDRPFIDHAPRAVTFASDARDAIRALGATAGVDLDVSAGVDTGAVSVGMTGGSRLVYDVWGGPVSMAHLLARSAGAGTILVSDPTHSVLPDEISGDATDVDGIAAWTVPDTAMGSLR